MSDLCKVLFAHCVTADTFSYPWGPYFISVRRGDIVACSCKSFTYRRKCRHLKEFEESGVHCGWMQFIDGGEPVEGTCPKCGRKVDHMYWGV